MNILPSNIKIPEMISILRPLILTLEHLCNFQYYSDKDIVENLFASRALVLRFITSTTNVEADDHLKSRAGASNENVLDQISAIANMANGLQDGSVDEAKVVYLLSKINLLLKDMKKQKKPLIVQIDDQVNMSPEKIRESTKGVVVPVINILCRTKESYVYAACIYTLYVNLKAVHHTDPDI